MIFRTPKDLGLERDTFTCARCGETFDKDWTDEEAAAEADAAFNPAELVGAVQVCDDCWLAMRQAMPDLDRRYGR